MLARDGDRRGLLIHIHVSSCNDGVTRRSLNPLSNRSLLQLALEMLDDHDITSLFQFIVIFTPIPPSYRFQSMELHAKVLIVDDDLNPLKGQESVGAKRIKALQTELRVSRALYQLLIEEAFLSVAADA